MSIGTWLGLGSGLGLGLELGLELGLGSGLGLGLGEHVAWQAFISTQHHKMVSGRPPTGFEMRSSSERANTHTATWLGLGLGLGLGFGLGSGSGSGLGLVANQLPRIDDAPDRKRPVRRRHERRVEDLRCR